MSQEVILNFLKQNRDFWFSSKYISKELKIGKSSTTKALSVLRKWELVDYKIEDVKLNQNIVHILVYRYKKGNNIKV